MKKYLAYSILILIIGFLLLENLNLKNENEKINQLYNTTLRENIELKKNYNDLLKSYIILNESYNNILISYSNLSKEFNLLYENYSNISKSYEEIYSNYIELNNSYSNLKKNYDLIYNDYNNTKIKLEEISKNYEILLINYTNIKKEYEKLYSVFYEPLKNKTIPTLDELKKWLAEDKTNEIPYSYPDFVCGDYAFMLSLHAKLNNWDMGIVIVIGKLNGKDFEHAFNAILCKEGLYYIEPQNDEVFQADIQPGLKYYHPGFGEIYVMEYYVVILY